MTFLEWREAAPGVLVAVAEPDSVNIALVLGGTPQAPGLLVDTGSSPEQGARLRADMVELTGTDPAGVVITHGHRDHWFGLAGLAGVPSFGHASLANRLEDPATAADLAGLGLSSADLVAPTTLLHLARGIDLSGRRVEIVHLGPGHTEGDLVVVVPDSKVVIAGDLVESAGVPQAGPDSALGQWPATLDGLVGVLGEDAVVIPGHGGPMSRTDVITQRAELAAVTGEARALIERGVAEADAGAAGNWPWPTETVAPHIARAYAELTSAGVRARPQLPIVLERGGS